MKSPPTSPTSPISSSFFSHGGDNSSSSSSSSNSSNSSSSSSSSRRSISDSSSSGATSIAAGSPPSHTPLSPPGASSTSATMLVHSPGPVEPIWLRWPQNVRARQQWLRQLQRQNWQQVQGGSTHVHVVQLRYTATCLQSKLPTLPISHHYAPSAHQPH